MIFHMLMLTYDLDAIPHVKKLGAPFFVSTNVKEIQL